MGINSDGDRLERLGVMFTLLGVNMRGSRASRLKKNKNRKPQIRRIAGATTNSS
jgi:hypothetical protein